MPADLLTARTGSRAGRELSRNGPGGLEQPARYHEMSVMGELIQERPDTAVTVTGETVKKFTRMGLADQSSMQADDATSRYQHGRFVIHPMSKGYQNWWYITVVAACISGWLVPFTLAFLSREYLDHPDGAACIELFLVALFLADMCVSACRGYYDGQGLLVMSHKPVLLHYLRLGFFRDLITTLPFDMIVLSALHTSGRDISEQTARWISLLSLLKLGRMYRVGFMFVDMGYNLTMSLSAVTITRNFIFIIYQLHWAACIFWYLARQQAFGDTTWVAAQEERGLFSSKTGSIAEFYIFSFYWAIVTFATLGYGDIAPMNIPEAVFVILYVALNIVVFSYVVGTVTLIVTRQDEEISTFREQMAALNSYCASNNLPEQLRRTMAGLLRMNMAFSNAAQGDEQVLSGYPTTIRRRVLHQLYYGHLCKCYLFADCEDRFIDALMQGSRVEMFLPKVDILSRKDCVNEVYVIIAGHVEEVSYTSDATITIPVAADKDVTAPVSAGCGGDASSDDGLGEGDQQALGGSRSQAGAPTAQHKSLIKGQKAAQKPVSALQRQRAFAETSSKSSRRKQAAAAAAVAAAAAAERAAMATSTGFGYGNRRSTQLPVMTMKRLLPHRRHKKAEHQDEDEVSAGVDPSVPAEILGPGDCFAEASFFCEVPQCQLVRCLTVCKVLVIPRSTYAAVARDFPRSARQVLDNLNNRAAELTAEYAAAGGAAAGASHHHQQQQLLANLHRLQQLANETAGKMDASRLLLFLEAAAAGNVDMVQSMLDAGIDPNSTDHEDKTALMVAAAKGELAVVQVLLQSGANPCLVDAQGADALIAAALGGHRAVIELLMQTTGKHTAATTAVQANLLCKAAFESRLDRLKLLLEVGCQPNAMDYERQTALHVAAAAANLTVVKLLLEAGADANVKDRMGRTPHDLMAQNFAPAVLSSLA